MLKLSTDELAPARPFNVLVVPTFKDVQQHPGLLWPWLGREAVDKLIHPEQRDAQGKMAESWALNGALAKPSALTTTAVKVLTRAHHVLKRQHS